MPPYPDERPALSKLRAAGFCLFTFTNNIVEVQERQMKHGGIADLFERLISVDSVKRNKPAPQAYAYVEKELGAKPSELCMIACHTWDTLGAWPPAGRLRWSRGSAMTFWELAPSRRSSAMT